MQASLELYLNLPSTPSKNDNEFSSFPTNSSHLTFPTFAPAAQPNNAQTVYCTWFANWKPTIYNLEWLLIKTKLLLGLKVIIYQKNTSILDPLTLLPNSPTTQYDPDWLQRRHNFIHVSSTHAYLSPYTLNSLLYTLNSYLDLSRLTAGRLFVTLPGRCKSD